LHPLTPDPDYTTDYKYTFNCKVGAHHKKITLPAMRIISMPLCIKLAHTTQKMLVSFLYITSQNQSFIKIPQTLSYNHTHDYHYTFIQWDMRVGEK
jgi:hypothetical protein